MTVLTAACGSHSGAYLDVHVDDPSIGTVALYIGDAPCMDPRTGSATACNGIAPAGETSSLGVGQSGGAWFRDSNETFTAKVVNGIAQFHLEPTGGDQTVEIIAIGYAGDPGARDAVASHVLDNVTIPAGDAIDIRTTLDAAAPVATNEDPHTPQPDGNYALVWTSINAPAECVLAEQWSGGKAKRTYIVPSEDSDCDGLLTFDESGNNRNPLECDPLWFDRKTAIASGASTCATLSALNSAQVCMIGGPACVDGVGSDPQTCARLSAEYCLPHDVCAQMCARPGLGPLGTCLDALVTATVSDAGVQVHDLRGRRRHPVLGRYADHSDHGLQPAVRGLDQDLQQRALRDRLARQLHTRGQPHPARRVGDVHDHDHQRSVLRRARLGRDRHLRCVLARVDARRPPGLELPAPRRADQLRRRVVCTSADDRQRLRLRANLRSVGHGRRH